MGSDGKNNGDGGPALGWDLFRLKWVAEPPVALAAALYGVLFIIFLLIAISGVVALWQLLAPIWTGASPAPSSQATDTGAELRGLHKSRRGSRRKPHATRCSPKRSNSLAQSARRRPWSR